MSSEKHFLALDLGAESGRGILGTFSNRRLVLSEVHRFQTGSVSLPTKYSHDGDDKSDSSLVWDFIRFWQEIKTCIKQTCGQLKLSSIGVDAWGVDFALLDKKGQLLEYPYHYRDSRTNGIMEQVFKKIPQKRIYEITGIQFMQLNTLYQLYSLVVNDSPLLQIADKLVMIPDLINFWLTGSVFSEFTDATTSQILDSRKSQWSQEIISALGFPEQLFPEIIYPGTVLGSLRPGLIKELACEPMVVAPPSHDTSSAVAAVSAAEKDYVWISSGTWSIVGINSPQPVINAQSFEFNFTNEGGIEGTYRFSKNVTGLWVVQQCRLQWQMEGKEFAYTDLTDMAKKVSHLKTIIDPDFSEFLQPGGMIDKINNYCLLTGQPLPKDEGELIRGVLQGLALRYRFVIEQLEKISGKEPSCIHMVGGGTKNQLLSQFTADAMGRKVITGPVEATAIGNIIAQAIAMGDITDWQEGKDVIRNSFEIQTFQPGDQSEWNKAYVKFQENIKKIKLAF